MKDSNMQEHMKIFAGKRVLVTGHTGFKGSWLAFILAELGAEVLGYALPPDAVGSHFEQLGLSNRIQHVVGDIRNSEQVLDVFQSFSPEIVFHLAAQALVRPSYSNPAETFSTNVMGSVSLLDAVRKTPSVRSLVFITSDKAYENVEWIWGYRESDPLGGRDPYSASKGAAEIVFSSYLRSFFDAIPSLGAASTRAGNVIGGGDWSIDRIVPDCVRAITSNSEIILRNPLATRPWQHVLEPLSGYLLLAARLYENPKEFAGSWNFGPETREVRTVHQVAQAISGYFGVDNIRVEQEDNQPHEANLLQLNCDKAHQLLGWYPRWGVDETLRHTAAWYHDTFSGLNVVDVSRSQLRLYFGVGND